MLAVNASEPSQKTIPNILPCSIKYNGPVPTEERYWSPTNNDDGTSTAYFRGRKLHGRTVKVPEGHRGAVLEKTDKSQPLQSAKPTADQLRRMEEYFDEDEDDVMDLQTEKPVEVKTMEQMASFDEIVVWGHEMVPEDDDVYVKGVKEWIVFAEALHSFEDPSLTTESSEKAAV